MCKKGGGLSASENENFTFFFNFGDKFSLTRQTFFFQKKILGLIAKAHVQKGGGVCQLQKMKHFVNFCDFLVSHEGKKTKKRRNISKK